MISYKKFLLISTFFFAVSSLFAQNAMKQITKASFEGITAQAAEQAVKDQLLRQALSQSALAASREQTLRELSKSVFTLKESDILLRIWNFKIRATAFAFEENYKGGKYLWGASATHYLFGKPAAIYSPKKKVKRVKVKAQGGPGMTDFSLFTIPDEMLPHISTLKMATQLPKVGDELFSMGYFEDSFHVETKRIVKEINTQRIITTLDRNEGRYREGACGSPVLNSRGELVGMHIGSSYNHQIGYVVPLNRLRQLLKAYRNNGIAKEELFFDGVKLGDINVNEYITAISTYKGDVLLDTRKTYHQEKDLDYAHLEKWMSTNGATKVEITITQFPFSGTQKDQDPHNFLITYDLRSKTFIKEQNDDAVFGFR